MEAKLPWPVESQVNFAHGSEALPWSFKNQVSFAHGGEATLAYKAKLASLLEAKLCLGLSRARLALLLVSLAPRRKLCLGLLDKAYFCFLGKVVFPYISSNTPLLLFCLAVYYSLGPLTVFSGLPGMDRNVSLQF